MRQQAPFNCSEPLAGPTAAKIALLARPGRGQNPTVMGSRAKRGVKRGGPAIALTAISDGHQVKGGPYLQPPGACGNRPWGIRAGCTRHIEGKCNLEA